MAWNTSHSTQGTSEHQWTIHLHIVALEATSDQWPFLEESHTHLSQGSLNVITFHFQEKEEQPETNGEHKRDHCPVNMPCN